MDTSHAILPIDKIRLNEVKTFIANNLHVRLNAEQIAQSMGYSKSTLTRHFLSTYHIPISRFILESKMKKAYELLTEKNKSITETGVLLGYKKGSAFTHAFTRHFGYSPIELFKIDSPF
jgi:AraC-like DNA-binding protein